MGYRHYFYKVKKSEVEEIKTLSYLELQKKFKELVESKGYISLDDILNQQLVFEFGKLYWDDTAKQIYSVGNPLFEKKETMNEFDDYVPYIVGKEGLEKAIEIYKSKIITYLDSLKELKDYKSDVKDRRFFWERYKVPEKNITDSWLYEHSLFNLVYLFKTINFEEETILFYGW